MARKYSYRYVRYIGKTICPKCGKPGYCQEGVIMGTPILKVDHRQWEPAIKAMRYERVCYC